MTTHIDKTVRGDVTLPINDIACGNVTLLIDDTV